VRHPLIGLSSSLTLVLALATPALGIVYGQLDDDESYPNVGALIGEFEGERLIFCSGTLIAADVFLTAAHCVDDGATMWVSFDPVVHEPVDETTNTLHEGTAQAHPSFACCGANNTFDIAVVVLDPPVAGITPADLPGSNMLGQMHNMELKSETFVAVGYGTVRETRRGAFQALFFDGQRRLAEQSALSLVPAWLNLSMNQATGDGGTCYGDSGGPHFLGSSVVSLTVTGDVFCKATDKTYRVDTPWARDFLDEFVTLP